MVMLRSLPDTRRDGNNDTMYYFSLRPQTHPGSSEVRRGWTLRSTGENMLTTSTDIDKIAAALAKAQGAMDNASKDRLNPAFKSKYADLASVRDAVNGPLSANGIAYVQAAQTTEHGVMVETRLIHESGQWFACTVGATPKAYDPQSIGSAITYLRRYGLMSMAGIAPTDDDDDGNTASGRQDGPPAWQNQRREEPPREERRPEPRREESKPAAPTKWNDAARKGFCADLDKMGLAYDDVAAWCESVGRPRPSLMDPTMRSALFSSLLGTGRAKFDTFLTNKAGK